VAEFLLEFYVSRTDGAAVAHGEERARVAAEELNREGTPDPFLRSFFVPEDETGFYLLKPPRSRPSGNSLDGRHCPSTGSPRRSPQRELTGDETTSFVVWQRTIGRRMECW